MNTGKILQQMWARSKRFLKLLLPALLVLSLLSPAAGANAAWLSPAEVQQAAEETPLLTGEYASVAMEAGDSIVYRVSIPADGDYLFQPDVESGDPANFTLSVSDEAGEVLYEGEFGEVELSLLAGDITLSFEAAAADVLAFFLLGFVGELSNTEEEPGVLYPGSIVGEADLEFDRFGVIDLPALDQPQELLIFIDAQPADVSVFASIEGDSLRYSSLNTRNGQLLRAWTDGGPVLLTLEPFDTVTYSVVVMLSGPPDTITVDQSLDLVIEADAKQAILAFEADALYESVMATVSTDDPDVNIDIELASGLTDPTRRAYGSEIEGDAAQQEMVEDELITPGTYYVIIDVYSVREEDLAITVELSGVQGPELVALESDVAVSGELDAESSRLYRFDVSQAGALISVDLIAEDEENTDFDLSVSRRPDRSMISRRTFNASESLHFIAPVAGTYYVEVLSEEAGNYELIAFEGDLAPELMLNDIIYGSLSSGGLILYQINIPGDGLFSAIVAGDGQNDIDLEFQLLDSDGSLIHRETSTTRGASEIVSLAAPTPGVYSIGVSNLGDTTSNFALLTRFETPEQLFVASLEIANPLAVDVCELNAGPTGSGELEDQLGEEVIPAGEAVIFEFDAGRYDLQAVDCDGNVVLESENVFLQGDTIWVISQAE